MIPYKEQVKNKSLTAFIHEDRCELCGKRYLAELGTMRKVRKVCDYCEAKY